MIIIIKVLLLHGQNEHTKKNISKAKHGRYEMRPVRIQMVFPHKDSQVLPEVQEIRLGRKEEIGMSTPYPREAIFKTTHEAKCGCSLVYEPGRFAVKEPDCSRLRSYTPDFFCETNNVFYEVVGTRQAYSVNKWKYDAFRLRYTQYKLNIVRPDHSVYPSNKVIKSNNKLIRDRERYEKRKYVASVRQRLHNRSNKDFGLMGRIAAELGVNRVRISKFSHSDRFKVAVRLARQINAYLDAHTPIVKSRSEVLSAAHKKNPRTPRIACNRGHKFTPENTGHQHGGRYCKTCQAATMRAQYLRSKQAKATKR
jgi:hypothetical protein